MTGYIYKCTFRGKIYIGESLHALNKNYLGTGLHWRQAISGYRQEVTKEILETLEAPNIKELKKLMREREIFWIAHYDSTNPEIGYNISPGGNLMAEETKQNMIQSDRQSILRLFDSTNLKQKISQGVIKHNKIVGFQGSIAVYCIIDNNRFDFLSITNATIWWHKHYPIRDTYNRSSYCKLIMDALSNKYPLKYKKQDINQNIKWYRKDAD